MLTRATANSQLQSYVAREEWDRVIALCRSIVLADTSRADCYALLGKALARKGCDNDAIAAFSQGLRRQPSQPNSHYALGVLYTKQDKYGRAIYHYQSALRFRPSWGQAAFRLGTVFHRIGYSMQALEAYQMAILLDDKSTDAHFALALLHESRGETRLAIKHYRKAILLQPSLAKAHLLLSRALMKMKAYEAASDVCAHAIALLPKDALLRNNLGQILKEKGETQAALVSYQQAVRLDEKLVSAHRNLSRLCRSAQDLTQAAGHLQSALALEPDNVSLLNDHASLLIAQGKWRSLIVCFRQAARQAPDWIAAYCQRTIQLPDGDLLFRLQRTCGRFLLALQQPESAATEQILKERLFQIFTYLGDLAIACDSLSRAEYAYRSALSIEPSKIRLYGLLGECLSLQGRKTAAISIYQAGLLQAGITADTRLLPMSEQAAVEQLRASLHQLQQAQDAVTTSDMGQALLAKSQIEGQIKGIYRRYQDWRADFAARQREDSLAALVGGDVAIAAKRDPKCGGVTCAQCMNNLIWQFVPVQVGKQSFQITPESAPAVSSLPTFTAEIPSGRVWVAPQKNAWDVCNEVAVFTPDGFLLGDLSRCYPWYLPGCERHDVASHSVLQRRSPLPDPEQLLGNVAILSGLSGHIYYHWMFDVLPRIEILQKHLHRQRKNLDQVDYFVVNGLEKAFQKETLLALGIPLEKVISSDKASHLQAEQLIVPSFAGHLDWVPPSSIAFLRKAFLPKEPPKTPSKKRIYVTRSQAKYRHIFNETAVVRLLAQFGFESIAIETLSVAQQAQLFAGAEAIIAPHGSGLANLAFCSPNATVIEFFSPYYLRTDYWMISQYLQLNHYYLVGESFECQPLRQLMYPSGLTEDFSIDLRALRALLKTAGLCLS